ADQLLLPLAAMLSAIGLVFVLRLRPDLAMDQLTWLVFGGALMAIALPLLSRYQMLAQYQYVAAMAGIGLLAITALFGTEINGARLWLSVGGFSFQSTELLKVLLIVFLAAYLAERSQLLSGASLQGWRMQGRVRMRMPTLPYLIPLAIIWGMTLLMLIWQKDVGAVAILVGVTLGMLYVATGRLTFVLVGAVLLVVNIALTYRLFGYVQERVDTWLDPWAETDAAGYQIVQSLYAFASGGFTGKGLGEGSPEYIPAVHTDFVFAALGEELGLLGAFGVLVIYLLFVFRGYRAAMVQSSAFGQLLALGAAGVIALQAIVIMAGNLALIPVTGVTLPFISYGGSSIVVNFVLLALLVRLSAPPSNEEERGTATQREMRAVGRRAAPA
ncbi:MAG TPA: FtsW/RodA/SpoVE family cell cycle protein, partial [Dehalococcoidia bacterium]|nr:FtsW/RodA/SpoVE family cell cycle protein [Dehalococcoidia bacterium]